MNFSSASKVTDVIRACDQAEIVRGDNRARVNRLFNGETLINDTDGRKMGLEINVNLGEAPVIAQHGRRQYNQAFDSGAVYFRVSLPDAPQDKASQWGTFITRKINKILKRSQAYTYLHRNQWASVLLHGVAPKVWFGRWGWRPKYIALEDFRVPTDTECSLENLSWFAVRRNWTEGELAQRVFGSGAKAGWNKTAMAQILDSYHDKNTEHTNYTYHQSPEKMAELIKQNGGFYASDAVPTIPLWNFYFKDDDNSWRLRVVPDMRVIGANINEFLYDDGGAVVQSDLNRILHIQFGDLNNKTPFLYHSVRSLGFLLTEPIFHSNLLQCRFLQHIHEHMNVWLRSTDPADRAKAQLINLYNKAFLPPGISIVSQNERHQIDANLVQMGIDRMKQLKAEASVSYTQDAEPRKEDETATGVMARVSAVNAMMSGLLSLAFKSEAYAYEEICRRFCLTGTEDTDCRRFQQDCLEYGIPASYFNVNLWDVEPEIPMGNGNPTMEMAKANALMQARNAFSPQAQQEILRNFTLAVTDNPRQAERLVPAVPTVTAAQEVAQVIFGVLLRGLPAVVPTGTEPIQLAQTLIGLISGELAMAEKTGNIADAREILGMNNAVQFTQGIVAQIEQDQANAPMAKEMASVLGKLSNTIKGFEQRLQEQQQQQSGGDPAAAAKIQAITQTAQVKNELAHEKAIQTQAQKEAAFHLEERRKDAGTAADIARAHLHEALTPKPKPATNGE